MNKRDYLKKMASQWFGNQFAKFLSFPRPAETVNEQLYSFRIRCRYIQYIPSKPAKYGLKCWSVNNAATVYRWNLLMFTKKDRRRQDH